jgi:hypothetical protein
VACGRIPSIISNEAAIRNARPDAPVSALSAAGHGACRYSVDWEEARRLQAIAFALSRTASTTGTREVANDAEDHAQDGCGASSRSDSGGVCGRAGGLWKLRLWQLEQLEWQLRILI